MMIIHSKLPAILAMAVLPVPLGGGSSGVNQNHRFTRSCLVMAGQPTPPNVPPSGNKGLIAGLIKGNQWFSQALIIRPASSGGSTLGWGRLTSHDLVPLGESCQG